MQFNNHSIKNFNTFGIDAEVSIFFSYNDDDELISFLKKDFRKDLPFFILGGGSNILFTKNFQGTIIHPETKGIQIVEETKDFVLVNAAAGELWDDFVQWTVDHGFYGAENLSFIPGCVGASPVQNIGAYGSEAKDIIHEVHCISIDDQSLKTLSNEECNFDYRDSIFKHELAGKYIVSSVTYKLKKEASFNLNYGSLKNVIDEKTATLQKVRDGIISVRKEKLPDPKEIGSAGSFFKNPIIPSAQAELLKQKFPNIVTYPAKNETTKIAAGWLIDSLGFKGFEIGGAKVHEKQALVLTNKGNATGEDVVSLAKHIQSKVLEQYEIFIEPEVIYL
ncbi:MAG: UDP-N-acetylmuramate dehydrogenase [Bacteroidales bacterium]|nr:UDP-N-acetylmuramate dehydrogenase [Bacteroidales bacterium]